MCSSAEESSLWRQRSQRVFVNTVEDRERIIEGRKAKVKDCRRSRFVFECYTRLR